MLYLGNDIFLLLVIVHKLFFCEESRYITSHNPWTIKHTETFRTGMLTIFWSQPPALPNVFYLGELGCKHSLRKRDYWTLFGNLGILLQEKDPGQETPVSFTFSWMHVDASLPPDEGAAPSPILAELASLSAGEWRELIWKIWSLGKPGYRWNGSPRVDNDFCPYAVICRNPVMGHDHLSKSIWMNKHISLWVS